MSAPIAAAAPAACRQPTPCTRCQPPPSHANPADKLAHKKQQEKEAHELLKQQQRDAKAATEAKAAEHKALLKAGAGGPALTAVDRCRRCPTHKLQHPPALKQRPCPPLLYL